MRIYSNVLEAVREVERDLFEMGIRVQPQTMQDKNVADNPEYLTCEVRAYGFQISGHHWRRSDERQVVGYVLRNDHITDKVLDYIEAEFHDRVSGVPSNPGNSFIYRPDVWNEFIHEGKFAYTYSERMADQVGLILKELQEKPESRQGIINIHSNIMPGDHMIHSQGEYPLIKACLLSQDAHNKGGSGRIPCSMYYQIMIREGKVDLIYTMRSCDFLVHFPVDLFLALRLQDWFANKLHRPVGQFTYFTGSLHAYAKDMNLRGIF